MRVLSVLHPGGGNSGLLRDAAAAGGHELVEWNPGAGEELPGAPSDFDAIAVFGGGMNVVDQGHLPWLTGEVELLRDAIAAGTPVLGICLGAQLLVAAAGGEVFRVDDPEIGWLGVSRPPTEDPVAAALPERFTAFQWHSYACRLPAGAVELASSAICPQAFALDGRAWGVQFHPEVTGEILDEWFDDYDSDPDAVRLGFDPEAARAAAREHLAEWNAIGRALFDAWLVAAERAVRSPA